MIDLHTHTNASDGIYSPEALIDLAAEHGIDVIAVCDHDTVSGLDRAAAAARAKGITIVPGIEFSIKYEHGTFHLLGMYVDWYNEALLSRINELTEKRATRVERMVEDLNKHGVEISMDDVMRGVSGDALGRPHVARALIAAGYARNIKDVFSRYLEEGLPGYVPKDKISFEEAVELIAGAGGLPVLAHPATLNIKQPDELAAYVKRLAEGGLVGIEVYSNMHDEEQIAFFKKIAAEMKLLETGGSDFHGDKKESLGCYRYAQPVPEKLYLRLKEFYEKKMM